MIRLGLVGGRGYVGAELIGLFGQHPDFSVVYVGSSSQAGRRVAEELEANVDPELEFQPFDVELMQAASVDVWVLAQGNGEASRWVEQLDDGAVRFLDISADYRFDDQWAYGLPESNRAEIQNARLVSNPGCYATAAQLALLPAKDLLIGPPHVFGISGYSGAGKTPSERNSPERLRGNILPYSLTGHLHEREVSHRLGRTVCFMPHVAEFFRGISVTVSAPVEAQQQLATVAELYRARYGDERLVDYVEDIPEIAGVRNTVRCQVGGLQLAAGRLVIVSVIDNLLKGAASQAVQNLNLMFGLDEDRGLTV